MPSTISAGTTAGTAIAIAGDTTGNLAFQTNGTTTAVTIDTSQNVGIGTSSPTYRLDAISTGGTQTARFRSGDTATTVDIASFERSDSAVRAVINYNSSDGAMTYGTSTNHPIAFKTNNTERMRIDTSGNLLVGTTAALQSVNTFIKGVGSRQICMAYSSGGYNFGLGVDSANYFYVQNQSGIGVYLSPNATSWTGLSDERLKTNLQPIENALEKVSTLRSVTGRYKTDSDDVKRAFLIAQDVQTVLPEAVTENLEGYLGLAYTETIPLLVAAIKELKAELDATKAEVAALKGA